MKHRKPLGVFFLSLFTLGIYAFVWHVKTKNELNKLGAQIPTAWLLIVPFANLYWIWKYSEGVEKVSGGKISAVMSLILLLLLSIVGIAILQGMFNGLQLSPTAPGPAEPEAAPATAPYPPQQPASNPLGVPPASAGPNPVTPSPTDPSGPAAPIQ